MNFKHILASFGLLLVLLVSGGYSLRCYDCWVKKYSPNEDQQCANRETLAGIKPEFRPLAECGEKENVCKKFTTYYYRIIKRGLYAPETLLSNVTTRICGTSDWLGCKEYKGSSSRTVECVCDTDDCNASQTHMASLITVCTLLMLSLGITLRS